MSSQSEVKYEAVSKNDLDQSFGSNGATSIKVNITDENTNPFTGAVKFNDTLNANTKINEKEYLQAAETSFSQAVSIS